MPQTWTSRRLTEAIRRLARSPELSLVLTRHAVQRMEQRGLSTVDVMDVLSHGILAHDPEQGRTPGSLVLAMDARPAHRMLRVVVSWTPNRPILKVITVMYVDDPGAGGD